MSLGWCSGRYAPNPTSEHPACLGSICIPQYSALDLICCGLHTLSKSGVGWGSSHGVALLKSRDLEIRSATIIYIRHSQCNERTIIVIVHDGYLREEPETWTKPALWRTAGHRPEHSVLGLAQASGESGNPFYVPQHYNDITVMYV